MSPGRLWYYENEEASVYFVIGKSRSKYGAIKKLFTCSDYLIYRTIHTSSDQYLLQQDLKNGQKIVNEI